MNKERQSPKPTNRDSDNATYQAALRALAAIHERIEFEKLLKETADKTGLSQQTVKRNFKDVLAQNGESEKAAVAKNNAEEEIKRETGEDFNCPPQLASCVARRDFLSACVAAMNVVAAAEVWIRTGVGIGRGIQIANNGAVRWTPKSVQDAILLSHSLVAFELSREACLLRFLLDFVQAVRGPFNRR
jgi:hypothetical protein